MNNKNRSLLESLDEAFSGSMSQEKVLGLMDETMAFFRDIKEKMQDPEQRQAALEETMEIKRHLDAKMQLFAAKTGIDLEELKALAESQESTMSPQDRSIIESAKAKFDALQEDTNQNKIN